MFDPALVPIFCDDTEFGTKRADHLIMNQILMILIQFPIFRMHNTDQQICITDKFVVAKTCDTTA